MVSFISNFMSVKLLPAIKDLIQEETVKYEIKCSCIKTKQTFNTSQCAPDFKQENALSRTVDAVN